MNSTLNPEQTTLVTLILSIIEAVRNAPRKSKWAGNYVMPDLFTVVTGLISDYVDNRVGELRSELHQNAYAKEISAYNRGVQSAREEYDRTMGNAATIGTKHHHYFNNEAIKRACRQGLRIEAIKELREMTSCGLKEAKDEIDRRMTSPEAWGYTVEAGTADLHNFNNDAIKEAMRNGNKISAIRELRIATGVGLREAKEELERREYDRPYWGYERY